MNTCDICKKPIRGIVKKATYNGVKHTACPGCAQAIYKARDKARLVPKQTRAAVFARDGKKCAVCGSTEKITLDHIKPIAHGGDGSADNLRVLCRPCNSRKGAR